MSRSEGKEERNKIKEGKEVSWKTIKGMNINLEKGERASEGGKE